MKTTKLFYSLLLCSVIGLVACNPEEPKNDNENTEQEGTSKAEELTDVGNNYFMAENGVYYKTTSSSTAEVASDINEDCYENIWPDIVIPEKVNIKGQDYAVTSIQSSAFFKCSALKSITIGNNVTTINGRAFYDNYSLKSVIIPNSVTLIEQGAFGGCQMDVYSYITNPEGVASEYNWYYSGKVIYLQKLYVPKGTKSIYQSLKPWKYAKQIIEMTE